MEILQVEKEEEKEGLRLSKDRCISFLFRKNGEVWGGLIDMEPFTVSADKSDEQNRIAKENCEKIKQGKCGIVNAAVIDLFTKYFKN